VLNSSATQLGEDPGGANDETTRVEAVSPLAEPNGLCQQNPRGSAIRVADRRKLYPSLSRIGPKSWMGRVFRTSYVTGSSVDPRR